MALLIALLVAIPGGIWRGYVLSIMWGWFIVPLGVMQIGIAHSIGISCILGAFMVTRDETGEKHQSSEDEAIAFTIKAILVPLFALGMGWVVHSFM